MSDLKLDEFGDILVENGQLQLHTRIEEFVAQRVLIRLRFIRTEWVYNRAIGYNLDLQTGFGKRELILADVRRIISETPGVTRIVSFDFTEDVSNRRLTINTRVLVESGEIITIDFQV